MSALSFEFAEYVLRGLALSAIAASAYLLLSPKSRARGSLLVVSTVGLLLLPLALWLGPRWAMGWIEVSGSANPDSLAEATDSSGWPWWQWAWLTGTVFLFSKLIVGTVRLRKSSYDLNALPTSTRGRLESVLSEAAEQLRLHKTPEVVLTSDWRAPYASGLIRPRIVLPTDACEWSAEVLRAVVLHELAHIGRKDLWMQWAGNIACAIHWFNPLVWFIHRRLAREREYSADSMVVECGTDPRSYAHALLDIASGKSSPAAAIGLTGMSRLEERIRRLVGGISNRTRRFQLGRAGAVTTGLFAVAACAWLDPFAQPPSPAPADPDRENPPSVAEDWTEEEVEMRLSASPFPGE